jgi:hypothetical protein
MTVHEWFVDPAADPNGNGSYEAPFRSLAQASERISRDGGDVNQVHIKARATLHERVPDAMSQSGYVGLYMGIYDGSEPATIDATQDCTEAFAHDLARDWYVATLGTHEWNDIKGKFTIGALLEDDDVLPMQVYSDDHDLLRAKLDGGGYACDWRDGTVYMVPTPNPNGAKRSYRAAVTSSVMSCGAPGPYGEDDIRWNRVFDHIIFVGGKRHGVEHNSTKTLFQACGFYACGGQQQNTDSYLHLGNGLEIAVNSRTVNVIGCCFTQVFDSGVTVQVYGNGQTVEDVLIEDCDFYDNGLAAVEISIQAGDATTGVRDVTVFNNRIHGNHQCFAPELYAGRLAGVTVIYNVKYGTLDDIAINENLLEDLLGNGVTLTQCGVNVRVENNGLRRCKTGIFFGANAGPMTRVCILRNTMDDCPTGFRTSSSQQASEAIFTDNEINGGDVAFLDASPASAYVLLERNTLNAARAIVCDRTENIEGSGNTSSGEIDPTFDYLFD